MVEDNRFLELHPK